MSNKPIRISLSLLAILLAAHIVRGDTYHVAQNNPQADNANPGSMSRPWKSISHAADVLVPGDTVIVHAGVYREYVQPGRSGEPGRPITYSAAPGERVVITGADVVTGWVKVKEGIWRKEPWKYRFRTHPNNERHRLVGRCEQVIVDGQLLKQVEQSDDLEPGCFCANVEDQVLYVELADQSNPNDHHVESSVRAVCFGMRSNRDTRDHIRLRGITVRYAANTAQNGALFANGGHWEIEDCEAEWTNGTGVVFQGNHMSLRRVKSHHHGQQGARGYGRDFLLEDVLLNHNNLKGYDTDWEAGAIKITHGRDGIVRRCRAEFNRGNAFWFDIDVRDVLIENCTARENDGHGVFIEISGGFQVRNNLCERNGRDGKWGRGGISVGESDHCTIEDNTCRYNPSGISIRELGPRSCRDIDGNPVAYRVHDIAIRRNTCAWNSDYQFGLWWDNPFFGPHPSPGADEGRNSWDPDDAAIVLDENTYGMRGDQKLALWGVPWRKQHTVYADLKSWQEQRGQDPHSRVAEMGGTGTVSSTTWAQQPVTVRVDCADVCFWSNPRDSALGLHASECLKGPLQNTDGSHREAEADHAQSDQYRDQESELSFSFRWFD